MSKNIVRIVGAIWLFCLLFAPIRIHAVGWTPTDIGLVLNFEPGDQFMLSVMIDGTEYFVCDYPEYSGGKFKYTAGNTLKLIPQTPGATEPSPASIWTVDTALTRVVNKVNYALGGISYTMWGNSKKTLVTTDSRFKYKGALSEDRSSADLCDVVFVVPTNRSTNADPNNTLDKTIVPPATSFDGAIGTDGFGGRTYREVYMFDIPRTNAPIAYTNASLVTFNTSSSTKKWNGENVAPGKVYFAYADTKHNGTQRTLFRIYPLNKPFSSCNSYFFGWNVQDYRKYRQSNTLTDSISARKIYTLDHFVCMAQEGETDIYKSELMQIPRSDSTYYYVGYDNDYRGGSAVEPSEPLGKGTAVSMFTKIGELQVHGLAGESGVYAPSAGAWGRMVADINSNADNLGVSFEPEAYFLKVSTGKNVRMSQTGPNEWISDEMWTISDEWAEHSIKATLQTGPVFRDDDPGADISGWSVYIKGKDVPTSNGESVVNKSGYARITTNSAEKNGNMVFVLADQSKCLKYDNHIYLGAEVPDQYPLAGQSTVIVKDARLKEGFTFLGWSITPGGDVAYHPDDIIDLPAGTTTLYAKATFSGTYNVAFSFMQGGKRYFLTQPTKGARFARARHFNEWTNVRQGMADAYNSDPNYVSTYKMIGKENTCKWCDESEYVLDPMRETLHGFEDSLTFYEDWAPQTEEFLGLYYTTPNTLLTNDTWAGLFQSSEGWPNYATPAVNGTKLLSEYYLHDVAGDTVRSSRSNWAEGTYLKYNAAEDQFDGVVAPGDATDFQISAVVMADAHYVILPDTLDASAPWVDEIVFDYHTAPLQEQVWSKLIGKQLMACMMVGTDTTYFHPNRHKTLTSANELRLSLDYRLNQAFTYIHDARPEAAIAEENSASIEETENGFCYSVISGASSPVGVNVDVVDTLRVWLRPAPTSKIKDYYGRWKTGAEGLHVAADRSRYRDILVKTKAYHYGDPITELVLAPKEKTYSFSALADQSRAIQFTLTRVTYRELKDASNAVIRRDTISTNDTTAVLSLTSSMCSLQGSTFALVDGGVVSDHVTIKTSAENASGAKTDTLTVTIPANTYTGVATPITVRVPLTQSSLQGDELVWSVVKNGKRYFIMAGESGLIFREYSLRDNTLYKHNTTTPLIKGAKNTANNDAQYITPWKYAATVTPNQVTLKTVLPGDVTKYIANGESALTVGTGESALTYTLVTSHANDNANYEEEVKLQYGADQWLKFTGSSLELTDKSSEASLFSWGYLQQEYNLLNNGAYPSIAREEFGEESGPVSIKTAYKAYREYSMLLDNSLTYLCREEKNDFATLTNDTWKTTFSTALIHDARDFDGSPDPTSGLSKTTTNFTTTVTPSGSSPMNVKIDGKYVDIVDTLQVTLGLAEGAPAYRFKDWEGVSSVSDACLKIPLVRKTYHETPYDSIVCEVDKTEYNFAFPSTIVTSGVGKNDEMTFHFETIRRRGTNVLDVDNNLISFSLSETDTLSDYDLSDASLAEIRLVDEYGNLPDWCEISAKTAKTVTLKCLSNGIRSPRSAYLYFAYIARYTEDARTITKYVNFRLTVSQASLFQYTNNQTLIHSIGASGDPLSSDGRQQVHENRRILYYYNPAPYDSIDQSEELPVRERGFYGWWRWYREGKDQNGVDVGDTDIPDSVWITPPSNVGRYNYPYRIIGDSVPIDKNDPSAGKQWVTMGRYTVFHFPAREYSRGDPPSKSPMVRGPWNKDTVTYVVDLGNYYDNLPLSMKHINQVDTAVLDTMTEIIEPTLSLREVFELHPWTEMAERLDTFKYVEGTAWEAQKYLEDHEVMAPLGNRLLLSTEQRYNYKNLLARNHTESMMGYYMRDDNWSTADWSDARKDTMIWCGGWDAECEWFTYHPSTGTYVKCNHPITVDDDFLNVPAKTSITAGQEADTVYYCLRARSKSTTGTPGKDEVTVDGRYWFNICRYKVIYHDPRRFGPLQETTQGGVTKAIITNDEIEQNYEVLERLNFDYIKPGKEYHVYPHPLPWADASYGYSYPVSPEVPDNRYHNEFAPNFPGTGEYGLINRIPYTNFWYKMEQHGGAENGYMIYCDGMSSSGQVAALSLKTQLCEGQKMYFSAFVGNPSNQKGKSNPNFTFSVQGWDDRVGQQKWVDITSYMTGDIQPSNKWSQIFFPINQEGSYDQFRVRIYNVASDFDGNDFILDDMCVFATKPPLIAYQANTQCVEEGEGDSITHVVLRVDYQGFVDTLSYNKKEVYYTVDKTTKAGVHSFVPMIDGYLDQATISGAIDTIYGVIHMPAHTYIPVDKDSIFTNLQQLVDTFDHSDAVFKKGYLYENLDGVIRPVLYVIHKAKMTADNTYNVRMATGSEGGLMNSKCAMTSLLKVTNRMVLELNGEELEDKEVTDMCANATYDLSVRVKGSLFLDSISPLDVNGSCVNDWLLYGDTSDVSSERRYGYKYSDIRKVIRDVLRIQPAGTEKNSNQFAPNLASINKNEIAKFAKDVTLSDGVDAYTMISNLVNNGFLTLYQPQLTTTVAKGDSIQYVIFPIEGTGTEAMYQQNMEVCTVPMLIKLKPANGGAVPMMVGGIQRDSTQMNLPVVVLVNARTANEQFALHIDSLMPTAALHSISLLSTDDPNYYEGVHLLNLEPDKVYNFGADNSGYYVKGNDILLRPATSNNYQMRPGYNYTFGIVMQTIAGSLIGEGGCPVGTVPFTVSVVPDYLRWAPRSADNNKWNDPENWIGLDENYQPIHENAHFAPISSTDVIIPKLPDGMPYPELPASIASRDSVKQVNFAYNLCDDIRFMPGAAISQQQRLDCDVAVVDLTIPKQTWALRTAPVTGMLSGDLFMSNSDINGENKPWYVGEFDANGRSYTYGNATFWLSLYNSQTVQINAQTANDTTSSNSWSKVTNGMTLSLPPAQGFAIFARPKSGVVAGDTADIRLPKNDDIYYYYGSYGEKLYDLYEGNLRAKRNELAGAGGAGKLAFYPGREATSQSYTLNNGTASNSFVFGNPTMGYIDIWGFIHDNGLTAEFGYLNNGVYTTVSESIANQSTDTISTMERYLPPMHAIVVSVSGEPVKSKDVVINTNRIVTQASKVVRPLAAPSRNVSARSKGIMTITAVNPVSNRCVSRLLLGQGYSKAIISGEDAVLTTLNINKFHMTNTPTTPFNIYAQEGGYGLSIDLRDSVVNVPLSFYLTRQANLSFNPTTHLWFTGVNTIQGPLVLYDALTDTERDIIDGICLDVETPEINHEKRYYVRRKGYKPQDPFNPIATDGGAISAEQSPVQKIVRNGHVYILRNGHVYTSLGQKVR